MQITRIHRDEIAAADPVLEEYLDAKAELARVTARYEKAQAALLDQMREKHQKSYKWTRDGETKQVTYVQGERTVIDEKGLRRALTAKVFDRYTDKKLNRKKMEEAMGDGTIDPMVVAKYVSTAPSNPYLRYTEHSEEAL